jgi:hypothetical protein
MTQHKEMIEEARRLLRSKNENLPILSHNVQDDYWLFTYPCGKVVKSFNDKRKRDIIIKESNQ